MLVKLHLYTFCSSRAKLPCGILVSMESIILKDVGLPSMVAYYYNPSTWEAEAEEGHSFEDNLVSSRAARTTQ